MVPRVVNSVNTSPNVLVSSLRTPGISFQVQTDLGTDTGAVEKIPKKHKTSTCGWYLFSHMIPTGCGLGIVGMLRPAGLT